MLYNRNEIISTKDSAIEHEIINLSTVCSIRK